jgi:hypothetical protein
LSTEGSKNSLVLAVLASSMPTAAVARDIFEGETCKKRRGGAHGPVWAPAGGE